MSRYIDADKAIEGRASNDIVRIAIACEPTADVRDVEKGIWIRTGRTNDLGGTECECSICGDSHCEFDWRSERYCKNCGARMNKIQWKEFR